ncbi:hypothetical protein CANCADRAFT_123817 [Tortispora caseinolytica NRRL Y-17796]|uniref:Zn(2)-C6 fungal-type domain-containing protein n=1 Tax=Tortispora caseinolytica NRRL Y-17796 TaxID=767744 RepID=A0A1E4T9U4_9ASCO|nr:hypothetical protein CANCADRAFT_123817 [Tortispora caseinolytica NRRL Y-17796]
MHKENTLQTILLDDNDTNLYPVRRRRAISACDKCRMHKLRCDDYSPCSNCLRNGCECVNSKKIVYDGKGGRPRISPDLLMHIDTIPFTVAPQRQFIQPKPFPLKICINQFPVNPPADTVNSIPGSGSTLTPSSLSSFLLSIASSPESSDVASPADDPNTYCRSEDDGESVPLETFLNCNKLPKDSRVLRNMFDAYFQRTQWYILVTVKELYEEDLEYILKTWQVRSDREDYAACIAIMLLVAQAIESYTCGTSNTESEEKRMISELASFAERYYEKILQLPATIHRIAFVLLYFTYQINYCRSQSCWETMQVAVEMATQMKLNEVMHKTPSPLEKECCRRQWQTMYTYTEFYHVSRNSSWNHGLAALFGASAANDAECIRANSSECNFMQYHIYRSKLYQFAGRITEIKKETNSSLTRLLSLRDKVEEVYSQFGRFPELLPESLRFDNLREIEANDSVESVYKKLQTVNLRFLYNYLLFSLLAPHLAISKAAIRDAAVQNLEINELEAFRKISILRCKSTAMLASDLVDYPRILKVIGHSISAIFLHYFFFSCGVLLCLILSQNDEETRENEIAHALHRISGQLRNFAQEDLAAKELASLLERLADSAFSKSTNPVINDLTSDEFISSYFTNQNTLPDVLLSKKGQPRIVSSLILA